MTTVNKYYDIRKRNVISTAKNRLSQNYDNNKEITKKKKNAVPHTVTEMTSYNNNNCIYCV